MEAGRYYYWFSLKKPFATISLVVGILIVISNIIEIRFIIKGSKKKKLHISQIYLLNLALSDIMLGLGVILMMAIWEYENRNPIEFRRVEANWLRATLFYTVIVGMRLTFMMSLFSLISLTVDRLLSVLKPLYHRKIKSKHCVYICVLMWLVSIVSCTLNVTLIPRKSQGSREWIHGRLIDSGNTATKVQHVRGIWYANYLEIEILKTEVINSTKPYPDWLNNLIQKLNSTQNQFGITKSPYVFRTEKHGDVEYLITQFMIYGTTFILLSAYTFIWYRMRKSHRFQGNSTRSETVQTVLKAKEKKFVKLAIAIVLAFVCCWLPFSIQATIFLYWGKYTGKPNYKVEFYCLIPILSNSIINPFVYFKMMNKVKFCVKCKK